MVEKVVSAAAGAGPSPVSGAEFKQVLGQTGAKASFGSVSPKARPAPAPHTGAPPQSAPAPASRPEPAPRVIRHAIEPGVRPQAARSPAEDSRAAKVLGDVQRAQSRLDQLLKLAESGRSFSPAELLAFQAQTYRATQELDLASKVVEKGTSAVKQTLQTQI